MKKIIFYFANILFLIASYAFLDILMHPHNLLILFTTATIWLIYALFALSVHIDACLGEKPELPENTKIKSETDSSEGSDKNDQNTPAT